MRIVLIFFLLFTSCNNSDNSELEIPDDGNSVPVNLVELPIREGPRPETTDRVPHTQIDVALVPEVHEEMVRRIYSIPGVEDRPSVVASWRGLWISEDLPVIVPDAIIGGREYAHIHDDGSLHIFLQPERAVEAVETGWAVLHPFAVQGLPGWDGFVMLYTPQSFEELNVTFQLIVDGFNYVTGQRISASDI